jgi:hypothetical protein
MSFEIAINKMVLSAQKTTSVGGACELSTAFKPSI